MRPEKYPSPLAKAGQDVKALLAMALEATVALLWLGVETLLAALRWLAKIPRMKLKSASRNSNDRHASGLWSRSTLEKLTPFPQRSGDSPRTKRPSLVSN